MTVPSEERGLRSSGDWEKRTCAYALRRSHRGTPTARTSPNAPGPDPMTDVTNRLRKEGVAEWLVAAVERLARDVPEKLDGLLLSVGDAFTLAETRATCRTHFVRKDANGRPRVDALAARLAERAVDYCIPRSRINEAAEYFTATGSTDRLVRLTEEARGLFTKLEKSGEGGELLLYTLLEVVLRIPQVLCKMPLKTSSQMHVHGTDGVHAKLLPDGTLAVYWGESKLHKTVNSAIDDCFESVAPFLRDAGSGVAARDLLLVRDHLDAGAEEVTAELIRYFSEDTPEAAKLEVRAACLVGFSLEDYPDPYEESGTSIREEVKAAMAQWHGRVSQRIDHYSIHDFELEIFCVPVPSVDDFRKAMRSHLVLR